MATKSVTCTIKGTSALLMHKFPLVPPEAIEKKSPEDQAEYAAYRVPVSTGERGDLYIPGFAVQRCLVAAATYSKGRGRATLQKPVAACVMVTPEYCLLGTRDYTVDARAVVNPSTRGRIVRYRPRLDDWSIEFQMEYDDTLLNATQLHTVVNDAGKRVGLLDFRPENKGPFGRFIVVSWVEDKED